MGSKNRINADFLRELSDAFEKRGREAIDRMIDEEPGAFVKVVASLLPKDVHLSARPFAELTDDELLRAVDILERAIAAGAGAIDLGAVIEGEAAVVVHASAAPVQR